MTVIPYDEKYRETVEGICIETASPDNKVNPQHRLFTLLRYCDEYLDHETCFLLQTDDGTVCGYILCAEDYATYAKDIQPYLERIKREAPEFAQHADLSEFAPFADEYPAHLHIDILEEYTGRGGGTQLMNALVAHLQENNVRGLMLDVSRRNARAYSFYRHCGFKEAAGDKYGAVMVMDLR